jgi:hypothetical protein
MYKWKNGFVYSFDQNWGESHFQSVLTFVVAVLQIIQRIGQKLGNCQVPEIRGLGFEASLGK